MKRVSVKLTHAWPTEAGLRRPQEGVITVTAAEAEAIEAAKAGEIVGEEPESEAKGKAKTGG